MKEERGQRKESTVQQHQSQEIEEETQQRVLVGSAM